MQIAVCGDIQKELGASYVADFVFVRRIFGNILEMPGDTRITIPRRSSEEVQETYVELCRKEVQK